jgi:D-glycero-D-manno-heptose 1,7-bisphosphate phosphatase
MVTYFAKCSHDIPNLCHQELKGGGIFLDRDGTIIAERNYLRNTTNLEFLPGAIPGLKKLAATGLPLYIFTNQAGVAHGYFNEETLNRIHFFLVAKLRKAGVKLRGIYYCPHHPQAENEAYRCDCDCRKPKPGLLKMAASVERLNLAKSYIIGDKLSDLSAGKKVAAKTALVLTGYGAKECEKINPEVAPDCIGLNLEAVADWVKVDLLNLECKRGNQHKGYHSKKLRHSIYKI